MEKELKKVDWSQVFCFAKAIEVRTVNNNKYLFYRNFLSFPNISRQTGQKIAARNIFDKDIVPGNGDLYYVIREDTIGKNLKFKIFHNGEWTIKHESCTPIAKIILHEQAKYLRQMRHFWHPDSFAQTIEIRLSNKIFEARFNMDLNDLCLWAGGLNINIVAGKQTPEELAILVSGEAHCVRALRRILSLRQ